MQVRMCPAIFNTKNHSLIPFLHLSFAANDNTGYPYSRRRVNTFVYDREKVGELESLRTNFVSARLRTLYHRYQAVCKSFNFSRMKRNFTINGALIAQRTNRSSFRLYLKQLKTTLFLLRAIKK